jgi:hypothetical protein
MNRTNLTLSCLLFLFLGGCTIGDPSAAKIVSLKLQVSEGQHKVVSVGDAEVQKALKLVDGVLVSSGLTRVPGNETPNPDGTIVRYQGPPTRGCGISLRNNKLEIVFLEFGRRRSTEPVRKIIHLLGEELEKNYGADRVKITTAN